MFNFISPEWRYRYGGILERRVTPDRRLACVCGGGVTLRADLTTAIRQIKIVYVNPKWKMVSVKAGGIPDG